MALNILYAGPAEKWPDYQRCLNRAFAAQRLTADLSCDHPAGVVDYIVHAPNGPVSDFAPFIRMKAVLGLWAGVEKVVANPTLNVPMTRMVDPGLVEGMTEWVTGQVLRHHLGLDCLIRRQRAEWVQVVPPLARQRRVGVLGLGELGGAAAQALARLNFQVLGFSQRPQQIGGVVCNVGPQGLHQVLEEAEILVLLLPLTPATENILNAGTIALLPKGAVVINAGRGALIDDTALLAALDSGRISHATLDVFRSEPLPPDHPFWSHSQVTVSPHVAAETRPETASVEIARNIRRSEDGLPLLHVVDRTAGY